MHSSQWPRRPDAYSNLPKNHSARHPELGDGYAAALVNFGYLANAVLSTDETLESMR